MSLFDYQTEQLEEIEALSSIFQHDFEVIDVEVHDLPEITEEVSHRFKITLYPNDEEDLNHGTTL
jgi:hypothetical protein